MIHVYRYIHSINSYIQKQSSNEDDFMNTGRNLASEMGNVLVMSISGFYSVVGMAFGIGLSLPRSLSLPLDPSLSLSLSLCLSLPLSSYTSSLRPQTLAA